MTTLSPHPPYAAGLPPWWRDVTGGAFWGIVVGVVVLWVGNEGLTDLGSLDGTLTSTGRLTGLLAAALLLIQVLLMARIPLVEQAWGQDQLTRAHRVVGFTSFVLLLAHVVLITLGYAAGSTAGLWGTVVDLTLDYPGMLLAIAGTAALCLVVVTSTRAVRRRLRYESWHLLHLYAYLGAGLALPHQLWAGTDFTASAAATMFWWGLYGAALAAVLLWRVVLPLWRSLRHPLRVVAVRRDSPTTTTITVAGRGIRHLRARAGQFFHWRFLDGPGWSRANPYSLSAAPDGRTLRITAEHLGDGSARLARLPVGTRVLVEGPYGRLHDGVRTRRKVLLLASGIGVTVMRALLESLPAAPGEVTVIHRVSDRAQAPLVGEIYTLASSLGHRYVLVEGRRIADRSSWLPHQAGHLSDRAALEEIVPDVAEHDVYLCGAPGWTEAAHDACLAAGVPKANIHLERFSY